MAIDPQASLLAVLVWRDGPMAALGHNHVIAARDVHGAVVLAPGLVGSRLELTFDVNALIIDDPALRAAEGADFAAAVPDSARRGTRDNMLGDKLLDSSRFATVSLNGIVVRVAGPEAVVAAQIDVKGRVFPREVNVTFARTANGITGTGEIALRQSELGLTPFSVMLGALQVRDAMRVRFRVAATT